MKSLNWTCKQLALVLSQYPKKGTDVWTVIGGREGFGKSVISRVVAKHIYDFKQQKMNLDKTLLYGRKSIKDALEGFDGVYIDDEAISNYSRTFYDKEQIETIKMAKTIRFHRNILFMNIPLLKNLDSDLRNRIVYYLFVYKRYTTDSPGRAHVFKAIENPFSNDYWNMKKNEDIANKKMIWKSPNYFGELIIPNLSKEPWFQKMEVEADKIKELKRHLVHADSTEKLDLKTVSKVLKVQKEKGMLTALSIKELCSVLNVKFGTIDRYMRIPERIEPNNKPQTELIRPLPLINT